MSKMFDDGYSQGREDEDFVRAWNVVGANKDFLAGYSVARASIDSEKTGESASYPYFLGCYSRYYSLDKEVMSAHYEEEFEDSCDAGYEEGIDDGENQEDEEYDEEY